MTQAMTAITQPTVQAPSCWTSFTTAVSTGLRKLAEGVAKLWTAFKGAMVNLYNAIAPQFAKLALWMKANPQTAALGFGVGAILLGVAVYYMCYRNSAPAQQPAQPAQQQQSQKQ